MAPGRVVEECWSLPSDIGPPRRQGEQPGNGAIQSSGRREPSLSMLTKLVEASGHTLSLDLVAEQDAPRGLPDTPVGRQLRRRRRAMLICSSTCRRMLG